MPLPPGGEVNRKGDYGLAPFGRDHLGGPLQSQSKPVSRVILFSFCPYQNKF